MQEDGGSSGGCGGARCGNGPGQWIWLLLALAVAGVLIVKQAGKKQDAAEGVASGLTAAVVQATAAGAIKTLPRLVDLGAGKCIPCKLMAPILADIKKTCAGTLDVEFIDVWENPAAGKSYGINLIPTQIFYDAHGKELFRHEGFFGKEDILAKWREFGVDAGVNPGGRSQKSE